MTVFGIGGATVKNGLVFSGTPVESPQTEKHGCASKHIAEAMGSV